MAAASAGAGEGGHAAGRAAEVVEVVVLAETFGVFVEFFVLDVGGNGEVEFAAEAEAVADVRAAAGGAGALLGGGFDAVAVAVGVEAVVGEQGRFLGGHFAGGN